MEKIENKEKSMDDHTMLSHVFGMGDTISFADEEYLVIENNGSTGVVCPIGETYYLRMFYWEFEGEKCKLVKKATERQRKAEWL